MRCILFPLFAAGLLTLISTFHASAEPPPGLDRFMAAAKRFGELQKVAQAKNTMPRLAEPEVADLLATLSDANSLFGTTTYNRGDMPAMLQVCNQGTQIMSDYSLSGLTGALDKSDSKDVMTRKVFALQAQNIATFQAEMIPIMAFSLRCQARLSQLMADFVSHLPPSEWTDTRREGLQTVRRGMAGGVSAGLMMLGATDGSLKPQFEAQMASALADTAPSIADMLPVAQRQSILAQAEKITPPTELKPALERIIAAMSRTDCEGLCQR